VLHTRTHKIEDFADADDLAHKLSTYKIDPLASRTGFQSYAGDSPKREYRIPEEIYPEQILESLRRVRIDLRSDRQKRTDHARAEACSPASRYMWSVDLEAWAKAAEWYENRPSGGETDGEALFACLAMFCPEAKTVGWRGLPGPEREAFERAAGKLQRHVVR
jgi:hypothetical protein